MRELLRRLGLRKMDEMERLIAFIAQRNAYIFLVTVLAGWALYESWRAYAEGGRPNLAPGGLLCGAVVIQGFSQLFMARKAVAGDEDSYESGPLLGLIMLVCVVAVLICTVGAAFLLLAVGP